jgi:hypothetical protein
MYIEMKILVTYLLYANIMIYTNYVNNILIYFNNVYITPIYNLGIEPLLVQIVLLASV